MHVTGEASTESSAQHSPSGETRKLEASSLPLLPLDARVQHPKHETCSVHFTQEGIYQQDV